MVKRYLNNLPQHAEPGEDGPAEGSVYRAADHWGAMEILGSSLGSPAVSF